MATRFKRGNGCEHSALLLKHSEPLALPTTFACRRSHWGQDGTLFLSDADNKTSKLTVKFRGRNSSETLSSPKSFISHVRQGNAQDYCDPMSHDILHTCSAKELRGPVSSGERTCLELVFSANGRFVVTVLDNLRLVLWDNVDGTSRVLSPPMSGGTQLAADVDVSVAVANDGRSLAIRVVFLHADRSTVTKAFETAPLWLFVAASSQEGSWVMVPMGDLRNAETSLSALLDQALTITRWFTALPLVSARGPSGADGDPTSGSSGEATGCWMLVDWCVTSRRPSSFAVQHSIVLDTLGVQTKDAAPALEPRLPTPLRPGCTRAEVSLGAAGSRGAEVVSVRVGATRLLLEGLVAGDGTVLPEQRISTRLECDLRIRLAPRLLREFDTRCQRWTDARLRAQVAARGQGDKKPGGSSAACFSAAAATQAVWESWRESVSKAADADDSVSSQGSGECMGGGFIPHEQAVWPVLVRWDAHGARAAVLVNICHDEALVAMMAVKRAVRHDGEGGLEEGEVPTWYGKKQMVMKRYLELSHVLTTGSKDGIDMAWDAQGMWLMLLTADDRLLVVARDGLPSRVIVRHILRSHVNPDFSTQEGDEGCEQGRQGLHWAEGGRDVGLGQICSPSHGGGDVERACMDLSVLVSDHAPAQATAREERAQGEPHQSNRAATYPGRKRHQFFAHLGGGLLRLSLGTKFLVPNSSPPQGASMQGRMGHLCAHGTLPLVGVCVRGHVMVIFTPRVPVAATMVRQLRAMQTLGCGCDRAPDASSASSRDRKALDESSSVPRRVTSLALCVDRFQTPVGVGEVQCLRNSLDLLTVSEARNGRREEAEGEGEESWMSQISAAASVIREVLAYRSHRQHPMSPGAARSSAATRRRWSSSSLAQHPVSKRQCVSELPSIAEAVFERTASSDAEVDSPSRVEIPVWGGESEPNFKIHLSQPPCRPPPMPPSPLCQKEEEEAAAPTDAGGEGGGGTDELRGKATCGVELRGTGSEACCDADEGMQACACAKQLPHRESSEGGVANAGAGEGPRADVGKTAGGGWRSRVPAPLKVEDLITGSASTWGRSGGGKRVAGVAGYENGLGIAEADGSLGLSLSSQIGQGVVERLIGAKAFREAFTVVSLLSSSPSITRRAQVGLWLQLGAALSEALTPLQHEQQHNTKEQDSSTRQRALALRRLSACVLVRLSETLRQAEAAEPAAIEQRLALTGTSISQAQGASTSLPAQQAASTSATPLHAFSRSPEHEHVRQRRQQSSSSSTLEVLAAWAAAVPAHAGCDDREKRVEEAGGWGARARVDMGEGGVQAKHADARLGGAASWKGRASRRGPASAQQQQGEGAGGEGIMPARSSSITAACKLDLKKRMDLQPAVAPASCSSPDPSPASLPYSRLSPPPPHLLPSDPRNPASHQPCMPLVSAAGTEFKCWAALPSVVSWNSQGNAERRPIAGGALSCANELEVGEDRMDMLKLQRTNSPLLVYDTDVHMLMGPIQAVMQAEASPNGTSPSYSTPSTTFSSTSQKYSPPISAFSSPHMGGRTSWEGSGGMSGVLHSGALGTIQGSHILHNGGQHRADEGSGEVHTNGAGGGRDDRWSKHL